MDVNKTFWVPLCPTAMVFDKRRKIWYRICFHVEITHFLEKFLGHKNPFPPISPCSRWLTLIIQVKLCKIRRFRGSTFGHFGLFWFKPNLEDFCLEIQIIEKNTYITQLFSPFYTCKYKIWFETLDYILEDSCEVTNLGFRTKTTVLLLILS